MNSKRQKSLRITRENGAPAKEPCFSCGHCRSYDDLYLIEKLAHLDREKIPERLIFSKGHGFFGNFVSNDMSNITSADLFSESGKTTKVFARLSAMTGSIYDIYSLSLKFYTATGIYDLISIDQPVFFIRDPIKFPDLVHALMPSPIDGKQDRSRFWDLISLSPESTNLIVRMYSQENRANDQSPFKNSYHSIHTYIWHTNDGDQRYVKYRILSSPQKDSLRHKLTLQAQFFTEEDIEKHSLKPFDATRLVPEDIIAYTDIGYIILDKISDNYFCDVEQSAFCPSNTVNGIALASSSMLCAHAFSASDSQRYRLGINYNQLEINRSINGSRTNYRNGAMCSEKADFIDYIPNSLGHGLPVYIKNGFRCKDTASNCEFDTDFFSQAKEFLKELSDEKLAILASNISQELKECKYEIRRRIISNISKASYRLADLILSGSS